MPHPCFHNYHRLLRSPSFWLFIFGCKLLVPVLSGQMVVRARYKGEFFPVVARKDIFVYVLKNGRKERTELDTFDLQQGTSFGLGFAKIDHTTIDYNPGATASGPRPAKPLGFRFEADVVPDRDLKECFALLPFVTGGSIGTEVFAIGSIRAGETKHLKLTLPTKVDTVGWLHVFSNGQEITSTQVTKAYDLREYFKTLRTQFSGVPALDLCKAEQALPWALSDDGKFLASVRDRGSYNAVVVYDLESGKIKCETRIGKFGVTAEQVRWVAPNEVVFLTVGNLKLLRLDDGQVQDICSSIDAILGAVKGQPHVLVLLRSYRGSYTQKYDVHKFRVVDEDSELGQGWVFFTPTGEPRLFYTYNGDQQRYSYRPEGTNLWKSLDQSVKQPGLKFDLKGSEILDRGVEIHSVAPGGDVLYISTRVDSDCFQLATYSLKEGVIKSTIAKSSHYDLADSDFGVSRLLFRKGSSALIGLVYDAEKPKIVWLDPAYAAVQRSVDHIFPDHVNLPIDWSNDGATFVYFSYSDKDPGSYYIYKATTFTLLPMLKVAEQLQDRKLAETTPFDFVARDGGTVHGYLTLPPENSTEKLPLIVNIHGGPAVRDTWSFSAENQYLATRGFAILQVNYRGSSGYGAAYQRKGLRARLDTVVIDDIADGVMGLIREGKIDPDRIGVMGGSFGGWATYISLIKYPNLYKAGVALAAVSHWADANHHDWWQDPTVSYTYWKNIISAKELRENEKYIDPLVRASELKQPIYIMHGDHDDIVAPEQADMMYKALIKTNSHVKYMRFPASSHRVWPLEDEVTRLDETGAFFEENLRPSVASVTQQNRHP